eukprot:g2381.t1
MNIAQLWDQLVDCVCRPPRDFYGVEDLIGGYSGLYSIGSHRGFREDLELENKDGNKLVCSHFKPQLMAEESGPFPCVVYCHCNSGSRRDAEEAVILLIPQKISVFCLDFTGSGLSDGEWVTLGAQEVNDLEAAIEYLREDPQISTIALWGRSMGAVTALLYSKRDPSISGMVLDSPFSKLNDLMLELVHEQQVPIPKALVRVALAIMRRSVRKRAGFDISTIAPLDVVNESFIPVLFGHADGDTFIKKAHSEKLMERYAGDKNLISFPGDHNSRRTRFFYNSVTVFFHNVFKIQGESVDAQPDLPVINGPHSGCHDWGETNAPWDDSQWHGRSNLLDSMEAILENGRAQLAEDGVESEDGMDETDLESLMALTQHRHGSGDYAWDSLLPVSQIEEDQMLQAALSASFHEANKEEQSQQKQQHQEQSASSQVPQETKAAVVGVSDEDPPNSSNSEKLTE